MNDMSNAPDVEAMDAQDFNAAEASSNAVGGDAELSAIYKKLTSETTDNSDHDLAEGAQDNDIESGTDKKTTEKKEGKTEESKPSRKIPATFDAAIQGIVEGLPDDKAEAILSFAEKQHQKLSELGRQASQSKEFKEIADRYPRYFADGGMSPAEAFSKLLEANAILDKDPVSGLMYIAKTYGVEHLLTPSSDKGDEASSQSLVAKIKELELRLQEASSPSHIDQRISAVFQQNKTLDTVNRFSSEKPFWSDVEGVLPRFIEIAKETAGSDSTHESILETAYDMAINALPNVRDKIAKSASPEADAAASRRAKEAQKAASINLKSSNPASRAPRTEDEALRQIWAKYT